MSYLQTPSDAPRETYVAMSTRAGVHSRSLASENDIAPDSCDEMGVLRWSDLPKTLWKKDN